MVLSIIGSILAFCQMIIAAAGAANVRNEFGTNFIQKKTEVSCFSTVTGANEVTIRRARLVLGWVNSRCGKLISV